jgi:plastocyanin
MKFRTLALALPTLCAALAAPAAQVTVDQVKEKFTQDALSLKIGDTVQFTNSDPVKHNLTVVTPDEDSSDLGTEAPGTKVSYTPAKAGTYDVRCSIHPKMKMKIKVD